MPCLSLFYPLLSIPYRLLFLSSPATSSNLLNLLQTNPIHAKKSLHSYPLPSVTLKPWAISALKAMAPVFSSSFSTNQSFAGTRKIEEIKT